MQHPRVTLVWHDAHTGHNAAWFYPDEEEGDTEPAVIESTGWLITPSLKEGHVTLAQSRCHKDGALGEILFIPHAMVVETIGLHPHPPRTSWWRRLSALL